MCKGTRYTKKEFLEETVANRVAQIVQENETKQEFFKEQDRILDSLDGEIRKQFEDFAGSLAAALSQESRLAYRQGLLDGLCLGHCAF